MKERIQAIMKERNLSAVKFAEILEVQPSSISHLISGRNNPNFEFIVKILSKFPEINPDWFIMGKGEMFRSQPSYLSPEKELSLPSLEDVQSDWPSKIPTPSLSPRTDGKKLEKIILLYSDQTFSVYNDD